MHSHAEHGNKLMHIQYHYVMGVYLLFVVMYGFPNTVWEPVKQAKATVITLMTFPLRTIKT